MKYLHEAIESPRVTPQSDPIPGSTQILNNAGGYGWDAGIWARLDRFLILGSEGGSYYARQRDLTTQNIDNLKACIVEDGERMVARIVEISEAGRAPKNDPALFALAHAASYKESLATRRKALDALPRVARTGTHLLHFAAFIDKLRGWGPAVRRAFGNWYLSRPVDQVAYQCVKYQSRDGWSHRDILRLAHPKPGAGAEQPLFRWITHAEVHDLIPAVVARFEQAKTADESTIIRLIGEGLTREMVPTEHQKSPRVWEALLEEMPLTAMIRTLGRMGACGLLTPMSEASRVVASRLRDAERLRKSRLHPIGALTALLTYRNGKGVKGSLSWTVVPQICEALEDAFYLAFQNVEPTGKRFYLGIDVSSSMTWHSLGVPGLTANMAAAAMAMLTARTEQNYFIGGFATQFIDLGITAGDSLADAMSKARRDYGGTDCAIAIKHAHDRKIPVDAFIVYTDGETWAGDIHAAQALERYRSKTGIASRLIVGGMVANQHTVADPADPLSLNIVGFDAAVPAIIADFIGGASAGPPEEE